MSVSNDPPEGILYNVQKSMMRSRHSRLKATIMFYKEAWSQVTYYKLTKYINTYEEKPQITHRMFNLKVFIVIPSFSVSL